MNDIPSHIAIIMDGNGRWAQRRGEMRVSGHKKGIDAARNVVKHCRSLGVKYLTLYTFSKENWNRPVMEVNLLMKLLEDYLMAECELLMREDVRFKAIGDIDDLPEGVRKVVRLVEAKTVNNTSMTLQLALSYGSRDEIAKACRAIAMDVEKGLLKASDVDGRELEKRLYTAGAPDPDLLIRTSGEMRLSNFMLWQSAYTELYVTEVLWPDFGEEELMKAIRVFQGRDRRFGLTQAQLAAQAK
ncbi:MAG: isoprenyl transferase [Deltaproteobacteria bacterium]|nr:isoprenyl transferase [Deltaproteobacteria bacterium]